jgi:magnesium-transporting ATPase (P-type)
VQLLWVNLIMDTLAALALATEPPTDHLLLQKPHGKTERIINNIMWKHIIGHAIFQLAVLLALLYSAYLIPWTTGYFGLQSTLHYTVVFNSFVWMQIFNELNARSIDDHQVFSLFCIPFQISSYPHLFFFFFNKTKRTFSRVCTSRTFSWRLLLRAPVCRRSLWSLAARPSKCMV